MSLSTTGPAADPPGGPDARPGARPGGPSDGGWLDTFRSLPKPLRVTTYACIVLVLVLLIAVAAGVALVRRPFPQVDGTIDLPGLSAPVTVQRDGHGIPQLYGDTLRDLMQAQGYVAAQDRFFEMDVRRHITAGRQSEMFGATTLKTDEYVRTLGWRRTAARAMPHLQPRTREALQAYADGVNAYLDHPLAEPHLARVHTARGRWPRLPPRAVDPGRLAQLARGDGVGPARQHGRRDRPRPRPQGHTRAQVDQLYPGYPYDEHPPIVEQGAVVNGTFQQDVTGPGPQVRARPAYDVGERDALRRVGRGLAHIPQLLGHGSGIGSNSWVVDGAHTTTGLPLLANDPHLGVSIPGIWMQIGLHCRVVGPGCPLDVSGFTFSGVPGVVLGHNADIAWGFTNLEPRRVRPLPRAGPRPPVAPRRPLAAAA